MSIKDYFKFFSLDLSNELEVDYIVIFNNTRPDINNYVDLKSIGRWSEYGEKGYRVWSKLPKDKFEIIISDEMKLSLDSFKVVRAAEFAGIRI
nr:hypothetical protein [Clostridium paraputrificum]